MTHRLPDHAHRRHAFTLLEVIVAMAMISTLMLVLYTSMTIAYRARKSAERTIAPARTTAVIADLISRDFENIQPVSTSEDFPQFFYGSPAGMSGSTFATVDFFALGGDGDIRSAGGEADNQPFSQGMREIYLSVRTDVQPPALVRSVKRNLLGTTSSNESEDEVLCTGVTAFSVQYWDGYAWTDAWDSDTNDTPLPVAVQINVQVQLPDGQMSRVNRIIPLACAANPATTDTTGGT